MRSAYALGVLAEDVTRVARRGSTARQVGPRQQLQLVSTSCREVETSPISALLLVRLSRVRP